MLAELFTEEEKKAFFERAGLRVSVQAYYVHVEITHGWWELEERETLCVHVCQKWLRINALFEIVMCEKLKGLLQGKTYSDNALIQSVAREAHLEMLIKQN